MIGENGQKRRPGADGLTILLGHYAGYLSQVSQVVYYPRGEELAQRHPPETRVNAG